MREGQEMTGHISRILKKYPLIVLDGAFATELERQGFSIRDELWSAVALYENPELVKAVHRSYLEAGADIIGSASYQATVPGFMKKGFTKKEAEELLKRSVRLVQEARDEFLSSPLCENRPVPLVAASVGPYGAYLADGSEYRGHYGVSEKELADFHRERLSVLLSQGPDILACETVPSLEEAEVIVSVLHEWPDAPAWISFSCRDEKYTCGGDLIARCAAVLDKEKQVEAIGVNCTDPRYVEALIGEIRKETDKPVAVYPNRGEVWDAVNKKWAGSPVSYGDYVEKWQKSGASLIGGCCRSTPEDIRQISEFRAALLTEKNK